MNILITAFEPFHGAETNPSAMVASRIPPTINGHSIAVLILPTAFHLCVEKVRHYLERNACDVVIGLGQAGGRKCITPERVAINIDDAVIPDNQGYQPIDRPILKDGPPAYFSQLPVKRIVQAMREASVPSALSNSAGTYVCNHFMYALAHLAYTTYPNVRTGFIHLPYAHEQIDKSDCTPSLSLDTLVKGIEIAIRVVIDEKTDSHEALGTIS